MDQISKIKGSRVLIATDLINPTLIEEAIDNKRLDVVKWLIKEELVYISDKTEPNSIFSLLKVTENIAETLDYLNSLNYTIITKHFIYANMRKAINEPAVLYWLLRHGGNIKELDRSGSTLLHWAIKMDFLNVFNLLLEMGADINAQDSQGDTPLHLAVVNSEEMAHCLIQHDCNIDAQNHDGRTPLFVAVECENPEVVSMLLCYNANTEIGPEGYTPFMHSLTILNDNNNISEMLLEYAYDINALTNRGFNAFYFAVTSYNSLFVEIIRRGGLWPNPSNFSELCKFETGLFSWVLKAFNAICVRKEDRVEVLKILFERSFEIRLIDINAIYNLYGFNDEFELLFTMPLNVVNNNKYYNCTAKLILDFESFSNHRLKVKLAQCLALEFRNINDERLRDHTVRRILALGRFISLRQHVAKFNDSLCEKNNCEIKKFMKVINEMPIVPSLQELSRNAVRAAIGRKFPGNSPSFYQNYLEKLSIPSSIVDIIRLKVPIY